MNLRPTSSQAPEATRTRREFADLLSGGGREHVDVVVPRTEIRGRMRLLSRSEVAKVHAETREYFVKNKMPASPTELAVAGLGEQWNLEIAVRICAYAVRNPNEEGVPLAIADEWRDCDDDQIDAIWQQYQDLRERLDPLGQGSASLTAEERAGIESAAKKGEASLLMHFGSRRLALYAISTVAPPAS